MKRTAWKDAPTLFTPTETTKLKKQPVLSGPVSQRAGCCRHASARPFCLIEEKIKAKAFTFFSPSLLCCIYPPTH